MAKQILNIGAAPNDGNGDPLRDAMDKVNDNFNELYTALGGNTPTQVVNSGVLDITGANKVTFLYNDLVDLPAASSYHGMFAHVHNAGAAYFAHAGSWIELANKSELSNINIGDLVDVDTTSVAPTNGQVLKWDGAKWAPANDANDGSVALTDFSVTVAGVGTANLAYNSTTGAFTYTPPDLSGYQLISNAFDGDYNSLTNKPTIPSAYSDSDVDTHLNTSTATSGQILSWNGADYAWVADQTTSGGGTDTIIAPVAFGFVDDTANGTGTGISWGNWNSGNSTLDFTFDSAQADANYAIITDSETFDNYFVGISNKTTTGFRAEFYDDVQSRTPSSFSPFTFVVYASTPTVTITGSNLSNASIGTLSDVAISSPTSGQVLKWNGANWINDTDGGSGGGIALTDLSVTVASAGTANLTYDNSTGVFTYTPPVGYANSDVDAHLNTSTATASQVLSWTGTDYDWVTNSATSSDTLSDVTARGATTNDAVTINNTLTVTSIDSTGIGFANLTSASDIVLNAVGDINASSSKITNVVNPTAAQDAATKAYVDSAILNNVPTFTVTAPDSANYAFIGSGFPVSANNPTLYLYRGFTYHFTINSPGHPFWINSVNGTGQGNAYNSGVTNNGITTGTITFTVPMDVPATLYYNCEYHSAMNGTITIV